MFSVAAVVLDNTNITIDEQLEIALQLSKERSNREWSKVVKNNL